MSGFMGKVLVVGLILVAVVGCTKDAANNALKTTLIAPKDNQSDEPKNDSPETQNCEDLGETPDYLQLTKNNVVTTYFDKQYNKAYLDGVAKSNAAGTIDFINYTGATVFKSDLAKNTSCTQSLFSSASIMPPDIKIKWTYAASTNDAEMDVLGLYLPKSEDQNTPTLNNKAAIVIRENTNRSTLIHEYMHHLFQLTATDQGYDPEIDKTSLKSSLAELNAITDRKDLSGEEFAVQSLNPFKTYVAATDSALVHFTLEEMAIEAIMKDEQTMGTLQNVPNNSNWYIHYSAKKAIARYEEIKQMIRILNDNLSPSYKEELKNLQVMLVQTNNRIAEIERITDKYPYDDTPLMGHLKITNSETHSGCAHHKEMDELLEKVGQIKFPTRLIN